MKQLESVLANDLRRLRRKSVEIAETAVVYASGSALEYVES